MLLQTIGGHFNDRSIAAIKAGNTLRGTGDNWDMRILRNHMRKDIQNEDLHLFASNIIINRIDFGLIKNEPEIPLNPRACSKDVFRCSGKDILKYGNDLKTLVARIIFDFCPKFSIFKSCIQKHIPPQHEEEMMQRSVIIPMPILDANENNYKDVVFILRTYESWIREHYTEAGILGMGQIQQPLDPAAPNHQVAEPGQPGAHLPPTDDDPMKNMKIPFSGDQLTRVRFAGAKDLLRGAHTPSDRFEHCSPFKPVMWHTKASFLQYCYNLSYNSDSIHEVGTLKYFREKYNRRNSTPKKVLDCYDGSEELVLSVGKAYIVSAVLKH